MTVKLTVYRYYEPITSIHESVEDAAREAIEQLNADASFPDSIKQDGIVIWTVTEAMEVRHELMALAGMEYGEGE